MAVDLNTLKCSKCPCSKGSNLCRHTDRERSIVIRRPNFKLKIDEEWKTWAKELAKKYAPDQQE
jgi:hypothetical protein